MTEQELIYIAGFFDGDGYVTIQKHKRLKLKCVRNYI